MRSKRELVLEQAFAVASTGEDAAELDTQQTATTGLVLMLVGALRSRIEFRTDGWFWLYLAMLLVALALNVTLYAAMERRARRPALPIPVAHVEPELPDLVRSA